MARLSLCRSIRRASIAAMEKAIIAIETDKNAETIADAREAQIAAPRE